PSQVNMVARQIELATHCPPVLKVRRCLPADQLEPRPAAGGQDTSAKGQPGPDEKTSPIQHSRPPSSRSLPLRSADMRITVDTRVRAMTGHGVRVVMGVISPCIDPLAEVAHGESRCPFVRSEERRVGKEC